MSEMALRRDPPPLPGADAVPETEPRWAGLGRYGRANLAVVAAQLAGWAVLLTAMDAPELPVAVRCAALVAFCLMMQGVFTMLHEYCHLNAHRDRRWNAAIGWVSATLFGTAPTLLRVQHWGHHRRNRTAAERAEFVHPGETRWGKTATYYAAILGGIWLGCLAASLAAVVVPHRLVRRLAGNERFNSFAAGFGEFSARDWRALRLEGAALAAVWGALVAFGPWRAGTLAVAYAGFAFSWSSLQWIYHLHTPLHVVEGAYNLRAPAGVRLLFLNFNYNLTHHRHPELPWQELLAASDPRETQPIGHRYLRVFRPPVPFPEDPSVLEKSYF